MKDGITLSEDRGINPRMTTCIRCGEDAKSLALIGDSDYLHECTSCGAKVLDKKNKKKCPVCKKSALRLVRRLDKWEKIPMGLCDACEAEDAKIKAVVAAGGIYWRCKDCKSTGAIKAESQVAKAVREKMGIEPPDECGVEFSSEDNCPVCGPNKVELEKA